MRSWLLACFSFCLINNGFSQTYSGSGGSIPDDGVTPLDIPLIVSGLGSTSLNSVFGLKMVCIDINHTWDADLHISLIAPDGTQVMLTNGNGGDGDNFTNTCFDQTVSTSIAAGSAPFNGTWKPVGNLGYINNGQAGNGTWHLYVMDTGPGDTGVVVNWSINFGLNPPIIAPFTSSNLPIVIINTNNQTIPDDPKLMVDMGIIYNGPGNLNYVNNPHNNYDGKIGIELRGSSSSGFPKPSYGLETWVSDGVDTAVSLLNLPKESDWILSANYSDKSLMNNALAYDLFNKFGGYAPRTRFVELILNGQYQGVYVFMEKIKRDSARVNISKLEEDDTSGSAVTGGYIIKIDKGTGSGGGGWTSGYLPSVTTNGQTIYYQYDYPKDTKIQPQQQQYIQKFVDSFEHALHDLPLYDVNVGWRKYGDEQSFIKYFIVNELSKNVDGYRLSTYLYKTKDTKGNKLYIGPPWDYDIAFDNADYCGGNEDTGWAYRFGDICDGDYFQIPFWWERLMQDTIFQNNLRCAYNSLRTTVLDTTTLFSYIDSNATLLSAAQIRNFEAWPILGSYVWPNPSPIPVDYAGEIAELKQFLRNRLSWLDSNIPGSCIDLSSPAVESQLSCKAYPNPFNNSLTIEVNARTAQMFNIRLYSIDGRLTLSRTLQGHAGKNILNLMTGGQPIQPGVYILQVQGNDGYRTFKMTRE